MSKLERSLDLVQHVFVSSVAFGLGAMGWLKRKRTNVALLEAANKQCWCSSVCENCV